MPQSTCTIDNCERPVKYIKAGLCNADYLRQYKALQSQPFSFDCKRCGSRVEDGRRGSIYCSRRCKTNAHKATYRSDGRMGSNNPPCTSDGCAEPSHARGLCRTHYNQAHRVRSGESERWDNPARRARDARRRAQKRGTALPGEVVSIDVLLERDNRMCGICRGAIPADIVWPDSRYPTIDHIIPLVDGGSHTYENTQPAHLGCNSRRGARPLDLVRAQ